MKTSDIIIRWLSKRIDKIIIVLSYVVLFLIILTLTPGILYQEKLAQIGVWQETREIKNNNFIVRYYLNTGDNKPTVLAANGDELLTVDGWASTVSVDNSSRSMWDHVFRNVAASNLIIHDIAWDNYQLMQTTTLYDNQVTFEYKFLSTENENVQLALSLKHRYDNCSTLTFDNSKINEKQENQDNVPLQLRYSVKLELDKTFAATDNVRYSVDNAPYWFSLTFYSENIPADERWHPVARLVMSYSPAGREQGQE